MSPFPDMSYGSSHVQRVTLWYAVRNIDKSASLDCLYLLITNNKMNNVITDTFGITCTGSERRAASGGSLAGRPAACGVPDCVCVNDVCECANCVPNSKPARTKSSQHNCSECEFYWPYSPSRSLATPASMRRTVLTVALSPYARNIINTARTRALFTCSRRNRWRQHQHNKVPTTFNIFNLQMRYICSVYLHDVRAIQTRACTGLPDTLGSCRYDPDADLLATWGTWIKAFAYLILLAFVVVILSNTIIIFHLHFENNTK